VVPVCGGCSSTLTNGCFLLASAVISAMIMGGLPCAVALFPQQAKIKRTSVEQQFHGVTDSQGKLVDYFYFNKGL